MAKQVWTLNRAAAKSRRKIEAAKNHLYGVAYELGDFDNYINLSVDNIMGSLKELSAQIKELAELSANPET